MLACLCIQLLQDLQTAPMEISNLLMVQMNWKVGLSFATMATGKQSVVIGFKPLQQLWLVDNLDMKCQV